jgi:hypothetical protein
MKGNENFAGKQHLISQSTNDNLDKIKQEDLKLSQQK